MARADDSILTERILEAATIIVERNGPHAQRALRIADECRSILGEMANAVPVMTLAARRELLAHAKAGEMKPRPQLRVVRADPIDTCEA